MPRFPVFAAVLLATACAPVLVTSRGDDLGHDTNTSVPSLNGSGVDVFVHGMQATNNVTYPCIRIPSLVAVPAGPLVAFMECRRFCGDECWPVTSPGGPRKCGKAAARQSFADQYAAGGHDQGGLDTTATAAPPLKGDVCMRRSLDGGESWEPLTVVRAQG